MLYYIHRKGFFYVGAGMGSMALWKDGETSI